MPLRGGGRSSEGGYFPPFGGWDGGRGRQSGVPSGHQARIALRQSMARPPCQSPFGPCFMWIRAEALPQARCPRSRVKWTIKQEACQCRT